MKKAKTQSPVKAKQHIVQVPEDAQGAQNPKAVQRLHFSQVCCSICQRVPDEMRAATIAALENPQDQETGPCTGCAKAKLFPA